MPCAPAGIARWISACSGPKPRLLPRCPPMAVEFDRSLIGQVFDETSFPPVTKEEILEFVAALGEKNPLYTDEAQAVRDSYSGVVAPLTLFTTLRAKRFTRE